MAFMSANRDSTSNASANAGTGATNPSRVLFAGPTLAIGQFRAPPGHARWGRENRINAGCIVFPRVHVGIRSQTDKPVIADPTVVMLYNDDDLYHADLLTPRGDECEWFAVRPDVLRDAVREFDPAVDERGRRILPFGHGRCIPNWYARQRRLSERVRIRPEVDSLWVEEQFLDLLHELLEDVFRTRGVRGGHGTRRQPRAAEAADAAKLWLAANATRAVSLDQAADAVGLSVFHLCRLFRADAGMTIHQYLTRLRLAAALERLTEGASSTTVALDCGFCSQSHFTDAFRRAYGVPPVAWRRGTAE